MVAQKNKPTEVRSKKFIYALHLEPRFKDTPIHLIDVSAIAQLRADLVEKKLSEKRTNNILAVLSKPLHYAGECNLIAKVPRMGMFKVERPEIVACDFAQYARLLAASKAESPEWYVALCLAGEAGLRVGEIKALRWREDVDLIARTITVNQQTCNAETTTPKGRTRRTIPMTDRLYDALRGLETIREGFVVSEPGRLAEDRWAGGRHDATHLPPRWPARAGVPSHAPHVRHARRAVRREPVAPAGVDGPQAHRRDDALRARGREPRAISARRNSARRNQRGGSGSPDPAHARRAWHICATERTSSSRKRGRFGYLSGANGGTRTPTMLLTGT